LENIEYIFTLFVNYARGEKLFRLIPFADSFRVGTIESLLGSESVSPIELMNKIGPPDHYRLNPKIASIVAPLERLFFALLDSKISTKWTPVVKDERILVLRTDHIGDMVLSSSFFRNLRRSFPDAEITVMCRKMNEQLARLMEGVDRVEVMNTPWLARGDRGKLGQTLKTLWCQRNRYDLALDLHPHPFNIVLGKILAKRMAGFDFRGFGFLLDLALADSPPGTHVVDRNLRLVEAVGGRVDNATLHLAVPTECTERVRAFLAEQGIEPNDFLVTIHPGAGMPSKEWPADRFAALIELFSGYPSIRVLLVEKDITRVNPIVAGLQNTERIHNLSGALGLLELIALIQQSKMLIGLESMVVHVAASVGTPVVELHSGQSSSGEWGVYQGDYEIITKDVDCAPCGRTRCEDNLCMTLITPTEVFSATKRLAAKVYGDESPFR